MQVTFQDIQKTGINNKPIVCITTYTAPMAQIIDPLVDIMLVGDSLGMTIYGFDSTVPVTIDMMIAHGDAVVRNAKHALVVVDMSYGTYEHSKEQALESAKRIMEKTKCAAVKLEGGVELADTIKHLVDNGIPVMGHIGLMPQSVEKMGGFKIQGRDDAGAKKVMNDALAVEKAGAFSVVIEGTIEPVARDITNALKIPTIGIGASPACDGQVLVLDDVIGTFTAFSPKFAKRFTDVKPVIIEAVTQYATDVKARVFPAESNCFYSKVKSEA